MVGFVWGGETDGIYYRDLHCGRCAGIPCATNLALDVGEWRWELLQQRVPGSDSRISAKMKKIRAFLFLLAASVALSPADLTKEQMAEAVGTEMLTVPMPSELFVALNKIGKPDWTTFYRDPVPTNYATRLQTAFNLGALVADGFIAVEAQDGQQVKNTGKDIITLARALGVGEDVLGRGKSISDFADSGDWFALREDIEATVNEVRQAMIAQRDDALASLIAAGAWLRAWQVGARAAELDGESRCADLLRQRALAEFLRSELQRLPEKSRTAPVVLEVDAALTEIAEQMSVPNNLPLKLENVRAIYTDATQIVTAMSAKKTP